MEKTVLMSQLVDHSWLRILKYFCWNHSWGKVEKEKWRLYGWDVGLEAKNRGGRTRWLKNVVTF